jgi:hypothetical protein
MHISLRLLSTCTQQLKYPFLLHQHQMQFTRYFLSLCLYTNIPILPVFPGIVPFLKEVSRCRQTFFRDAQMSRCLIWQISHSDHCNNAICPYPPPMVSEFGVCYLWFRTCVCGNRSSICLVMLAMVWWTAKCVNHPQTVGHCVFYTCTVYLPNAI